MPEIDSRLLKPILKEAALHNKDIVEFPKEIREALIREQATTQFCEFAKAHQLLIDASPALSRVYKDLTESKIKKFFAFIPRKIAKLFKKPDSSDPYQRVLRFERFLLKGKITNALDILALSNDSQQLKEMKLNILYKDALLTPSQTLTLNQISNKMIESNKAPDHDSAYLKIGRLALQALTESPPVHGEVSEDDLEQVLRFCQLKYPRSTLEEILPVLNFVANKAPQLLFKELSKDYMANLSKAQITEFFIHLAKNDKPLLLKIFSQRDPVTHASYFHNIDHFLPIYDFLKKLARHDANLMIDLFSLQDENGKTILHDPHMDNLWIYPNFLLGELKTHVESDEQMEAVTARLLQVFALQDSEGKTCMHNKAPNIDIQYLFLSETTAPLLADLLGIKDKNGNPVLFHQGLFSDGLSYCLSAKELCVKYPQYLIPLCKITGNKGNTLFHEIFKRDDGPNLKRLLPLFASDQLVELLEVKNTNGKTPLECVKLPSVVKILIQYSLKEPALFETLKKLIIDADNPHMDVFKEVLTECHSMRDFIEWFLTDNIPIDTDALSLSDEERQAIAHLMISNALLPALEMHRDVNIPYLKFVLETSNLDFQLPEVARFAVELLNRPRLLQDIELTPHILHNCREGIKAALTSPMDPDMRQILANIALETEFFEQDDPFFPTLVNIVEENPNNPRSSHQIYIRHLKNLEIPTAVIPPVFWINSDSTSLSLTGLQAIPKLLPKNYEDIPTDATKANWNRMRLALKTKIEGSDILKEKYSDFPYLWHQCLSDPFLETSLEIPRGSAAIPPHKLHFAAIVHWLLSLDNTPIDGVTAELTQQEEALYNMAYFIAHCHSGKRQNISAFYFTLPMEFKYPADVAIFEVTEEKQRALQAALMTVEQAVAEGIQKNRRLLSGLTGLEIDNQEVHAINYIQNSIGNLIGLGSNLAYDPHTGVIPPTLFTHSRDEILEAFLHTFTPETLIETFIKLSQDEPLEKKADEDTFNDLMAYLISPSTLFWSYSDEGTRRTLTRLGAMQILKELKVVSTVNPRIISSWPDEFAFLQTKSAEELDVIPQWDDAHHMTFNMRAIKAGILEHLKGRSTPEKCQWLAKWIERSGESKTELQEHVPLGSEQAFEDLWNQIVAEITKNYIGIAKLMILDMLGHVDSLSTVTLLEGKSKLVDTLVPSDEGFDQIKQQIKQAIDAIALERLGLAILEEGDWLLLNYADTIEFELSSVEAKEKFSQIANNENLPKERWQEFMARLSQYRKELEQEEFDLQKFNEFCDKANAILPDRPLETESGYQKGVALFESLIQKVMDEARKEHVLDLKKTKEKFDPLAAKLGEPPMEIDLNTD